MPEIPGTNPETGLYHIDHMLPPDDLGLRSIREKQLTGAELTIGESLRAGRDITTGAIAEQVGNNVEVFQLKPDHVYRTIGRDSLKLYEESGAVIGFGEDDEYEPGNNAGVDWYLGGVAVDPKDNLKYGDMVIEAPADPRYFQPASEQGSNLAIDPRIRHMKSSGHANPVPAGLIRLAHDGRGDNK